MAFTDADEVMTYLGGVFQMGFDDAELAPKLAQAALVLRFDYSDPATRITVDTAQGLVVLGDIEGVEPDASLEMAADLANKFWQGKVNLPMAMARGQVKVGGNRTALLKLAPLGKKLYPIYTARLADDGRGDLVA